MSRADPPGQDDVLVQAARLREERQRAAAAAGEPSLGRRLAQIGVLGWTIVTPTVLGLLLGRWLDGKFTSGLLCTGALLLLGLGLGCWSAWKWMKNA